MGNFLGSPIDIVDVPGIPKHGYLGIINTVAQVAAFGATAVLGGFATNMFVNQVGGMLPGALQTRYTRPVLHASAAALIFAVGRKMWPGNKKNAAALALAVPSMLQAGAGIIRAVWTTPPASDSFLASIYNALGAMSGGSTANMSDYIQVDGTPSGSEYEGVNDYIQVEGGDEGVGALYEAGMGSMYEAGLGDEELEMAASPF